MPVTFELIQQSENSEYWNLNYDSDVVIAGFSFNMPEGTCEHSNGNGAAHALPSIMCSGTLCMGLDVFGVNTIPAGSGLFLILHNKNATQLSISNIKLSDINANPINTQKINM